MSCTQSLQNLSLASLASTQKQNPEPSDPSDPNHSCHEFETLCISEQILLTLPHTHTHIYVLGDFGYHFFTQIIHVINLGTYVYAKKKSY